MSGLKMKRIAYFSILMTVIILVVGLSTFMVAAKKVIGSTTVTLYPIADSHVISANPDSNYGDNTTLLTKKKGSNISYVYIMFDLSSIPKDAYVISATLSLALSDIGGLAGSIGAHYCSDDSWTELGITWNNKPDFAETATSVEDYGPVVLVPTRSSWNVTTDVRTALGKGKLTEVLVDYRSSSYAYFKSREGSYSPRLEVEYAVEPIYDVHLESVQDTVASKNLGYITFAGPYRAFFLPEDIPVVPGSYEVTYNSGYFFIGWETSGGVSVSDAYAKTTTVTVSGTGTLRAVGSGERIEYGYDDGYVPSVLDREPGQMAAVRFTPVLSDKLTIARIYFFDVCFDNVSRNKIKIHILDANREDLIAPITQTPISKGWFDVDLSAYGLTVAAGNDFYIAVEWTVDSNPNIGTDYMQPDERSWYWDGASWRIDKQYDYMIRAVVGKASSTISCTLSPSTMVIGGSVTISSSISPPRPGATVYLQYSTDGGGTWNGIASVTADSAGSSPYMWTPASIGTYEVKVSWAGDAIHHGAESDAITVTVAKKPSEISCTLSKTTIQKGESITVSGSISPLKEGVTVTLNYTAPDGTTLTRTATTTQAGAYSDTYTLEKVGLWSVETSWNGDEECTGAESPPASFEVLRPAAFGVSDLMITPAEINVGEPVSIMVDVTNTGGVEGTCTVALKIDGVVEATKDVTLASGATETVTFTITKDVEGTHDVEIAGLPGTLTVTPKPTDWLLIGGIIVALIIVCAAFLFLRQRP